LRALNEGMEALKQMRADLKSTSAHTISEKSDNVEPPQIKHQPISTAQPGKPLTVSAEIRNPSGVQSVRLHYRHLRQDENYIATDMAPKGKDIYEAIIPGDFLDPTWDL